MRSPNSHYTLPPESFHFSKCDLYFLLIVTFLKSIFVCQEISPLLESKFKWKCGLSQATCMAALRCSQEPHRSSLWPFLFPLPRGTMCYFQLSEAFADFLPDKCTASWGRVCIYFFHSQIFAEWSKLLLKFGQYSKT